MTRQFAGKVAVVTGASRGIGAATVDALLEVGATVARLSRSELEPRDGCMDIRVDLTDIVARESALNRLIRELGTPDLLVNNAGVFLIATLEETSDSLLREQLAINLEAPFALARRILPLMRERGSGHHVLVGSVADHTVFPGNSSYSASKFGARGMHEVLIEEFRGSGVQCSLISPGPTDTGVWDPIDPDNRDGFLNRSAMLQASDVAEAIVWAATRPARCHVEGIQLGPG